MLKVLLTVCLVAAAAALSNRQHITMCTLVNLSGVCEGFEDDETQLGSSSGGNYDNIVQSVRLTGTWLFYEYPNYNEAKDGWVEIYWGKNKSVNLPYANELSSIRHVGDIENMNFPSVTGYSMNTFQGVSETFTHLMVPQVYGVNINSLIITGQYSWTLYSGNFYSGESFCVTPMYGQPVLIINVLQELGYTIGSIKLGCHANEQGKVTQNLKPFSSKTAETPKKQMKHKPVSKQSNNI